MQLKNKSRGGVGGWEGAGGVARRGGRLVGREPPRIGEWGIRVDVNQ